MDQLSLNNPSKFALTASLSRHQTNVTTSVENLSSGKLTRRSGDNAVGLYSVATKMTTRVIALKGAQINNAHAASLLQTADGGLSQIQTILERMGALSVQANSGGLAPSERSFLNLEFQGLKSEIDRISTSTNFNNVNVLEGSSGTFELVNALMSDSELSDTGTAIIDFVSNPANARRIRLQNVQFQFRTTPNVNNVLHVQRGATTAESVQNLVNHLNSFAKSGTADGQRIDEARYEMVSATSFAIISKSTGELARNYSIDEQGSNGRNHFNTLNAIQVNGSGQNRYILNSNETDGLSMNDTQAVGGTLGGMIESQSQTSGEVRLSFTGQPGHAQRIRIDNGFNGTNQFHFRTTATVTNPYHIQIGATVEESIENAVIKLNEWTEAFGATRNTYVMRQLEYQREGTDLVMTYKGIGNATDIFENDAQFTESITNATLSAANMTSGTDSGVNVQGVVNADFIGKLEGFAAEYTSSNQIELSIEVGASTYSATVDTAFTAANSHIRLDSDDGGYFDIPFTATTYNVTDQDRADSFAEELDHAMSGLTFYQERNISTYRGNDVLADTTLDIRLDDFSQPLLFEGVEVTGYTTALGQNESGAVISFMMDGEEFRSVTQIDKTIEAYQQITFESTENRERQMTFTNSNTELDINNDTQAATLQKALESQMPIGKRVTTSGGEVNFQIGDRTSDTLSFAMETTSTETLFEDNSLHIATDTEAAKAFDAIQLALDAVGARRAYVGALQSRTNYVASSLESSIIEHESARASITDTDIGRATTNFALSSVKTQSAIAMIAQTNNMRSNILDIVDGGMLSMMSDLSSTARAV